MSLGGLLGHALLGGVQGGATAAQQVAKRREEFDLKKELIDIEDAKARARLEMQNAFQVERDGAQHGYRMDELAQSNEYQTGRDQAKFNHDIQIAQMSGGLKSGRVKVADWTDPNTGQTISRRYDSATGDWLDPVPGGAGAGVTPEMDAKAREIARERVNNQAGWLSSDSSDFAEFGGSRQSAEEQFYREELQKMSGQQVPAGNNPLIQAVQSGQFQLRDPGEAQAATGGGASDPAPQPSNAQQPPPAVSEFSPTASLGGLLQSSPDDWQQQNASYNKVKPAVQNVKSALERGMSPSKEDFERARPYLSEKEIQEVERQFSEDAQYR